jgi:hypothetical protein
MRAARGLGAEPPSSSSASSGTKVMARTSCVAAAFIAPVSVASVCRRRFAVFMLSRSTRPIAP